jgi:hypothetical protein
MSARVSSGTSEPPQPQEDLAALRREHDDLAQRLAARRSIDEMRKAAYAGFFGFIATGLSAKLAWDRWFSERLTRFKGPPVYFFIALAVTCVLLVFAARAYARSRRFMLVEDVAFARMKELRARLRLDP